MVKSEIMEKYRMIREIANDMKNPRWEEACNAIDNGHATARESRRIPGTDDYEIMMIEITVATAENEYGI